MADATLVERKFAELLRWERQKRREQILFLAAGVALALGGSVVTAAYSFTIARAALDCSLCVADWISPAVFLLPALARDRCDPGTGRTRPQARLGRARGDGVGAGWARRPERRGAAGFPTNRTPLALGATAQPVPAAVRLAGLYRCAAVAGLVRAAVVRLRSAVLSAAVGCGAKLGAAAARVRPRLSRKS